MKLSLCITSCNLNKMYLDFLPLLHKVWNKLVKVPIKFILIANKIPKNLMEYKDNIILFEPISNIKTSFQAQIIRLLYPCILNVEGGVIITDMDILPMNRTYYVDNIKDFSDNDFIFYRSENATLKIEYALCYNVAHPKTWKDIFNINSLEDIRNKIKYFHNYSIKKKYNYFHTDQTILKEFITKWKRKNKNFKIIGDKNANYNRLCRGKRNNNKELIKLEQNILDNVKNHKYSDYHMLRPYLKFKKQNDIIVYNLLKNIYNYNMTKIHFISYGDGKFKYSKKRIKREAQKFGLFDTIKIYGSEDLTNEFKIKYKDILKHKKGGGYWIWKFDIIQERLNEINDRDFLIYIDAGCEINIKGKGRFIEYLNMLNNSKYDIISFVGCKPEREMTIKQIFDYTGIYRNSKKATEKQSIGGVLIMQKGKHCQLILDKVLEMIDYDHNLITDYYNNINQFKFFKDHRHDQSILSIVRKIYGSINLKDETLINYNYGNKNRTNYPFIASRIIN